MKTSANTWPIIKASWLFFSVLNVDVGREICKSRKEIKKSHRRSNFSQEKLLEYSEMSLEGGRWSSQGCWQHRGGRMSNRPREA